MKKFFILPLVILFSLIFTNNASALNVGTASFDLHYKKNNNTPWRWQNNMLFGNGEGNAWINYVPLDTGSGYVNLFQFNTADFSAEGNHASLHFETNIVLVNFQMYLGKFVNLPYIKIQSCSGTGAFKNMQVLNKSISYATTKWNNWDRETLTLYGDVSFKNIGSGSGKITCQIGNPSFSFIASSEISSVVYQNYVYFEKNPITINFGNNINDSLLQTQINQNSTIINQNSTVIKNQNEIKDFLKSDIAPSVDTNKTPSVGLLPPGVFDSIINMPLNLMNVIVSSLGGSCSSITAPLPYVNKNLTLPCFSDTIYKGEFKTALDIISIPVVAIIFYGYFKKIKERFERAITMNTTEKDEWGIL